MPAPTQAELAASHARLLAIAQQLVAIIVVEGSYLENLQRQAQEAIDQAPLPF